VDPGGPVQSDRYQRPAGALVSKSPTFAAVGWIFKGPILLSWKPARRALHADPTRPARLDRINSSMHGDHR